MVRQWIVKNKSKKNVRKIKQAIAKCIETPSLILSLLLAAPPRGARSRGVRWGKEVIRIFRLNQSSQPIPISMSKNLLYCTLGLGYSCVRFAKRVFGKVQRPDNALVCMCSNTPPNHQDRANTNF